MLLVSSILSAVVVGVIGYELGRSALRDSVFDRLTQIRQSQLRAVQAQFSDLKNSVIIYTHGSTAVEAVEAFTAGFDQLANATITPAQQQAIVDYYNSQLIKPTEEATGDRLDINALLPTSNAAKYLQAFYTAPFKSDNESIRNDDARDGSAWSAANARYNDFFRQIVTRFDFGDALLLDTRGIVVYCANKDVDLGTNILTGPYRESNLRDAYQKALGANSIDFVWITDFEQYQPQLNAPTGWIVSPVGGGGRIEGVLALPFPISKINRLMTADKKWEAAGMGSTGETYLAGSDSLMRSDSRIFLQNPAEYKREVVAAGTHPDVADEAIRLGGTTLVQPVASAGLRAAQRGEVGTLMDRDYTGTEELEAYAPLDVPDSNLHWSILATLNNSEAFAPESAFTKTIVLTSTAIVFVICVAAMLLAQLLVRPIRRLEAGAQRISAGDYDITVPVQTRDEIGDLTQAFNEMSRNLALKEELLNEQRRENTRLLLSLMPESVVERYRQGEEVIAQDHQDVTVIFADFVGLDQLQAELTSDEALSINNELIRQIDAAAEDLGVERVRTVHNGYLASCGLNVPRLDNVRRTVDFALQMQRIVERFNTETGRHLGIRAGIDTGRVSSGLVGRSQIVYDLWGGAVNLAYQVQSGSPQTGIYVTARVYEEMRDTRHFTPAGTVDVDGSEEPTWRLSERTS
ncbi:MAG TPA: adenylate/guanylate cyclase domain-containing protein [Mycobacterium sp.]|nr:adenylate/guanylate cyclase domain-containing protein [Mycobacterium sp.]HZA09971.1 adenylate/guanylate cyclase domain-containing protein [Mycobacterium sp.]